MIGPNCHTSPNQCLHDKARGFTLIELVITMVISMIIASAIMKVISRPFETYASSSHRAKLINSANVFLSRFANEVSNALPNSVRVGCSGECLEFLSTLSGGRYRRDAPGASLTFNSSYPPDSFDVLGPLMNNDNIVTGSNADDCQQGNASCLVIYNTGANNNNAYALDNIATITDISPSDNPNLIEFNNDFNNNGSAQVFPSPSPEQRFQIVTGPVTYLCDTTNNTLQRYTGYPITEDHTDVDTDGELTAFTNTQRSLVSNKLSDCSFSYDPGAPTRSGVVTLSLTLTENLYTGHSENITLLQQAHVNNAP